MNIEKRKQIVEAGAKSGGRTFLLKHFNGERLTARQMAIAKCYDCMGYNTDGRQDCKTPHCPIYPIMPYKKPESRE